MSISTGCVLDAQISLVTQLQGFWANDLWDMHRSPVANFSPHAKQRWLRFDCASPGVNVELKYLCWQKFSTGAWRSTQELSRVHRLIRWLNSMDSLPASLMERDFETWRDLYRGYLAGMGRYTTGTTVRMDRQQKPLITGRDSHFIGTLRQVCILLSRVYDVRPAHERDTWDMMQMGVSTNLSQSNVRLSFLGVRQQWLRVAAKSYLRYSLPLYSASTCRTRLQSIACFSNFLATSLPQATESSLTRSLLLQYVGHLQGKVGMGTSKNHVLNLRNFLRCRTVNSGFRPLRNA